MGHNKKRRKEWSIWKSHSWISTQPYFSVEEPYSASIGFTAMLFKTVPYTSKLWTRLLHFVVVVVQLLSYIWLSATPWTVPQPGSSTISRSLLKFTSKTFQQLKKNNTDEYSGDIPTEDQIMF